MAIGFHLADLFGPKSRFLGANLESEFEKQLNREIGHLLVENGFRLVSFKIDTNPGESFSVFRTILKNREYQFAATYRFSMGETLSRSIPNYANQENEYVRYVLRDAFQHLIHSISEEILKYIENTPLPQRKKTAGQMDTYAQYMNNWTINCIDSNFTTMSHEEIRQKEVLSEITHVPKQIIESNNIIGIKNIALLIAESKSRLKDPFKTKWDFKHFK